MLSFPDYKRAVKRYSWVAMLTGIFAFGLFDAVMWINLQLLGPYFPAMRTFFDARLSSGWQEVILPLSFFALSSPPSLLLLIFVIRRARRQAALRCPSCDGELASCASRRHVLQSLHCPHCRQQVVESLESPTSGSSNASPHQANAAPKDYKQLHSEIRGHLRFAAIAWGMALPLIYGIVIWSKTLDGSPDGNWLVVALAPIGIVAILLGMMWVCAYCDLARARKREEDLAKLHRKAGQRRE